MAAKKKPTGPNMVRPVPANDPGAKPLDPGAMPSAGEASGSPALALQARLHRQLSPQAFDFTSRFVTLAIVFTLAGIGFASNSAYLTV